MTSNAYEFNIDQAEINKFSAIASEWWDPNGKFKPLHTINPLRLNYILSKISDITGKTVLDVGCGGGILAESLAKKGAKVTGLDCANLSLQVATAHAKQENQDIKYCLKSVEQHAAETQIQYDVITCMELLEHVPHPASIINACASLLAPEGHLFLSTINRNPKSHLFLIIGAEYIARLLPIGTHDFTKFIRPSELMRWLEQNKLKTREFKGMEYRLFENEFALTNNVDVNYLAYVTH